MYISDEKLKLLKELAQFTEEEQKIIKLQGLFACASNLEISLIKGCGIISGNMVVFKVKLINV